MLTDKATLAAQIDTLTMSEPHQPPHVWRPAFESLNTTYRAARTYRRFVVLPLCIAAAAGVALSHELWADEYTGLRGYIAWPMAAGALVYAIMTFPFAVFRHEARVSTLLRYYGVKLPNDEIAL